MPVCPGCHVDNLAGVRFCDQCGTTLPQEQDAGRAGGEVRVVRIGREEDNDIVLPTHQIQVGRQHVRVTIDGTRNLLIEDLDTRNGTFVNRTRLSGPMPFSLRDEINFGSYTFNTALLQPFVSSTPRPSAEPARRAAEPAPPGPVASGEKRACSGALLDAAFDPQGAWMRRFMSVYGVIALTLFFLPMFVTSERVLTAISVLGEARVGAGFKLALACLPLLGVSLLVLSAARASQVVVGAVLLGVALPALGVVETLEALLSDLAGGGWRFALRWLCLSGTASALLYRTQRPADPVGRVLLAVFAGMLAFSFFLPMEFAGEDSFELAVAIRLLAHADGHIVVAVIVGLLPFVLAPLSLSFLGETVTREHRGLAQHLALTLVLLPALSILGFFALGAVGLDQPGLIVTGTWFALFFSLLFLFPTFGGALLLLGARRR